MRSLALKEPKVKEADWDENPEWTKADFARARAHPVDPNVLKDFRRPGERGTQKAPTKRQTTIRLSQKVLDFYRSSGVGWQTRLNEDLEGLVSSKAPPASVR